MLTEKQLAAHVGRFTSLTYSGHIPKYIRLYDNGGKSADRYTCVYTRLRNGRCTYLGMSDMPFHPQGFGQHGEHDQLIDRPKYAHLGKPIKFTDLNHDCKRAILQDYREIWNLNIAVKFRNDHTVANVFKWGQIEEDKPRKFKAGENIVATVVQIFKFEEKNLVNLWLNDFSTLYLVPKDVLEFSRIPEDMA